MEPIFGIQKNGETIQVLKDYRTLVEDRGLAAQLVCELEVAKAEITAIWLKDEKDILVTEDGK